MQKIVIRITSWWQGLNLQQKLGMKIMGLGALLLLYAILGLAGIAPNPLNLFHKLL